MNVSIVVAGLSPHPPLVVPPIGGSNLERVAGTVAGLKRLAVTVAAARPQATIIISPHGPVFRDAVSITTVHPLRGDFGDFGLPDLVVEAENSPQLAGLIVDSAGQHGIKTMVIPRTGGSSRGFRLDHGTMVPLWYLQEAGVSTPVVPVGVAFLPFKALRSFGRALEEAAQSWGRPVAVIASGDLSHRLHKGAPAGYDPEGESFDRLVVEALTSGDLDRLMELPGSLVERAGECGLRPLIMLSGALKRLEYKSQVFSYEGPFGVGYAVAMFSVLVSDSAFALRLARESLEAYTRHGQILRSPEEVPPGFRQPSGAFVSLKKQGRLRGCIGTVEPRHPDLAREIIHNAVSAGTCDPRFPPVTAAELPELKYSVDVLHPPEPVRDPGELDARRYGVIVKKGGRTGLLLPNLEGVDVPAQQLRIARQKAGISPWDQPVEIYRFEVTRYGAEDE